MFIDVNRRPFKAAKLLTVISAAALLLGAGEAAAALQDWTPPYYPYVSINNLSYAFNYNPASKQGTLRLSGTETAANPFTLYVANGKSPTPISNGRFSLTETLQYSQSGNGTVSYKVTGGTMLLSGRVNYSGWTSTGTLMYSNNLTLFDAGIPKGGSAAAGEVQIEGVNSEYHNKPTDFSDLDPNVYVDGVTNISVLNIIKLPKNAINSNGILRKSQLWAPIPGTALLFGAGLAGLFGFMRRKPRLSA